METVSEVALEDQGQSKEGPTASSELEGNSCQQDAKGPNQHVVPNNQTKVYNMQSEEDLDEEENLDKCNVFVKHLPSDIQDSKLFEIFSKFGDITSAKVMVDHNNGMSLGFGFVRFAEESQAAEAIEEMNGKRIENKTLLCKFSYYSSSTHTEVSTNLYIKPLLPFMNEEHLRQLFCPFGNIIDCKVMIDKITGQSRQIGFVRFNSEDEARYAMTEMNGTILQPGNPPLVVKYAETKKQRTQRKLRKPQILGVRESTPMLVPGANPTMMPHYPASYPAIMTPNGPAYYRSAPVPYMMHDPSSQYPGAVYYQQAAYNQMQPPLAHHPHPAAASPTRAGSAAFSPTQQYPPPPPSPANGPVPSSSPHHVAVPLQVLRSPATSPPGAVPFASGQQVVMNGHGSSPTAYRTHMEMGYAANGAPPAAHPNALNPHHFHQGSPGAMLPVQIPSPPLQRTEQVQPTMHFPVEVSDQDCFGAGSGGGERGPTPALPNCNLFVFHLPSFINDNELQQMFGTFGPLESVKVITERVTGESKGYGFVKYYNVQHAMNAVTAMNGYQIGNKHLKVNFKTESVK